MEDKPTKEAQPLNPQQELFCHEYIKDRNATQAYIRAGYSENGADSNSAILMVNHRVRARINQLIAEQFSAMKIEARAILKSILNIAEYDPADAYEEDGTLKNIKDMPLPLRKAIAGIEVDELWEGKGRNKEQVGVTKKIRFWNKNEALRDLGRHLKLFVDITENPVLNNLADEIKAARKRLEECHKKQPSQKPSSK